MTLIQTARARRLTALNTHSGRDSNVISLAQTRAKRIHKSAPAMFVSSRTSAETVRLAA